jgi:hypothetical protein
MDNYAVKEPHRCSGCGSWLLGEQPCSVCKLLLKKGKLV